ncbi:dimethylaniline monooxygenase [N-oxide-forming] 2 [Hydra vulgaris]|uniref:Flavin-containing monooxygenase n=1 Tax=Hydra vulgaris TaxID=6087 RepID=A0ABM4CN46_HYDVU
MANAVEETLDLVIIGAGWSGLLACKYAKEENLQVRVLETRDDLGGVWNFSPDPNVVTVMKNTCTTSSSSVTEISDFPMPCKIGNFPKHSDIWEYLNSYAKKHDLRKKIHFNCRVSKIFKENGVWIICTELNFTYYAKNLMICTGVHQKANRKLEETLFKNYTGELLHSGCLKEFRKEHQDLRIMVLGGGETSSDVLDEWYPHVKSIVWCIPRGQHFFRKYAKLLPHREPQALDKASSRALKLISPQTKGKPGLAWICRWTTSGSLLAYEGHGIPEFRSNNQFFHAFINKHAHVLDYIDYKKVIPKGPIDKVVEKKVFFADGTSVEVDVIIQCTGYQVDFPFLPDAYKCNFSDLYKLVYDVNDTSLSYIGYARPVIGSIPGMAEMTSRWVVRVIAGHVKLATFEERTRVIEEDKKYWEQYFQTTSRRITTLVEAYTYIDSIAKLSNCYPDYWALFKKSPKDFFTAYFAPYNGCCYRLNEPDHCEQALNTLRHHSKGTITPWNLLTILFFRIIMFDWFCDILCNIKYKMQTSPLIRYVQKWRVIRFLDYIWCTPKRLLFDNRSKPR